ncbi:MAG: UPF0104 family protein [Bdellovibrionales bacterium]|nr:UPF0104 family protein [Ramlibacter sp.]
MAPARDAAPSGAGRQPASTSALAGGGSWWPWVRRALTLAFFVVVATMLFRYAGTVNWREVWAAIRAYPWPVLMAAAVLAGATHLLYSTYDLLGRHYTQHGLRVATVMKVTFICYAFNLNLGSLVGGVALRYRLYSRLGLSSGQVTRILSLSMITNWLGYLVLAGLVFTFWPLALPSSIHFNEASVPVLGMSLLAAAASYLVICGVSRSKVVQLRGVEISLPSLPVALLQVAMSCANWLLMSGVVYLLMPRELGFSEVLSVLLIAAVAGVITHVPAGLGVLEAVFVALLSHRVPEGQLLAGLLTYRALYYLVPFAMAVLLYLLTETHRKSHDALPEIEGT